MMTLKVKCLMVMTVGIGWQAVSRFRFCLYQELGFKEILDKNSLAHYFGYIPFIAQSSIF